MQEDGREGDMDNDYAYSDCGDSDTLSDTFGTENDTDLSESEDASDTCPSTPCPPTKPRRLRLPLFWDLRPELQTPHNFRIEAAKALPHLLTTSSRTQDYQPLHAASISLLTTETCALESLDVREICDLKELKRSLQCKSSAEISQVWEAAALSVAEDAVRNKARMMQFRNVLDRVQQPEDVRDVLDILTTNQTKILKKRPAGSALPKASKKSKQSNNTGMVSAISSSWQQRYQVLLVGNHCIDVHPDVVASIGELVQSALEEQRQSHKSLWDAGYQSQEAKLRSLMGKCPRTDVSPISLLRAKIAGVGTKPGMNRPAPNGIPSSNQAWLLESEDSWNQCPDIDSDTRSHVRNFIRRTYRQVDPVDNLFLGGPSGIGTTQEGEYRSLFLDRIIADVVESSTWLKYIPGEIENKLVKSVRNHIHAKTQLLGPKHDGLVTTLRRSNSLSTFPLSTIEVHGGPSARSFTPFKRRQDVCKQVKAACIATRVIHTSITRIETLTDAEKGELADRIMYTHLTVNGIYLEVYVTKLVSSNPELKHWLACSKVAQFEIPATKNDADAALKLKNLVAGLLTWRLMLEEQSELVELIANSLPQGKIWEQVAGMMVTPSKVYVLDLLKLRLLQ
ncbi:hypothetical protein DFS34DRAFT_597634 [Phlyctochytrium arcticum]|nr:hypothetical protein DFS34DRAFT_597634 [Phlyctochytrium arcticum]